ncbi:DKNYY domain-containing protein [Capnocytophaga cynodegmi]|uniref:DKNYY domain-containing protein n=1 Tax=Capnocytophaga cynodegmi TaxID=28189 RepID=UPI0037D43AB4
MISQKNLKRLLMMALIGLGGLALLIVLALMNNLSQPNLVTAQRIGTSIFYHHDKKVYAEVAGAGYLPIYSADPESFEVLEGINQSVGWDKNKVYCGNGVLDGMKGPVKALGNGLYSDGTTTYYCSFTAENIKTNMVVYFLKSAFYTLTGKKYSDYQYTTIKIDDTGKKFHPINDIYALSSDGTQFYYKGQLIQGAKARLFAIANSDATDYFSDGKQLFYQSKPLDATYSPDWASARYSAWGDFQVLYHKNGGQIFVDGKELNPNQPPYKVFSLSELYAQHLFFYDDNTIYAYDNQQNKAIAIGKNHLNLGKFTEFSDGYFTDGKDILYFSSYEDWPQGRRNNYMGLRAFTTMLGKVKTSSAGAWTSWGNPKLNLWQKGDELYYFDTHGRSQYGFFSEKAKEGEIIAGAYRVADRDALQTAIQHDSQLSDSKVEQLINDGVFITAENEVLFSVTTKIKDDTSHLVFWVLIFGVATAALVMYYLKFSKR